MANVQIRDVPEGIHQTLRERARRKGMSLSDYLLAELRALAERPTMEEFFERLAKDPETKLTVDVAEIIREGRDNR